MPNGMTAESRKQRSELIDRLVKLQEDYMRLSVKVGGLRTENKRLSDSIARLGDENDALLERNRRLEWRIKDLESKLGKEKE